MKRTLLFFICAFIATIVVYSCKPNDQKLQQEVQNTLNTNYPQVSSSVRNGVVTLTGTVMDQRTKNNAEQAARSVKHVNTINNNIDVRNTQPQVTPVSNMNTYDNRVYNDSDIRTNLNNRFRNDGYNDVTVTVRDGEVILTGDVKRADLQRVLQIANEQNPRRVTNNLTIK